MGHDLSDFLGSSVPVTRVRLPSDAADLRFNVAGKVAEFCRDMRCIYFLFFFSDLLTCERERNTDGLFCPPTRSSDGSGPCPGGVRASAPACGHEARPAELPGLGAAVLPIPRDAECAPGPGRAGLQSSLGPLRAVLWEFFPGTLKSCCRWHFPEGPGRAQAGPGPRPRQWRPHSRRPRAPRPGLQATWAPWAPAPGSPSLPGSGCPGPALANTRARPWSPVSGHCGALSSLPPGPTVSALPSPGSPVPRGGPEPHAGPGLQASERAVLGGVRSRPGGACGCAGSPCPSSPGSPTLRP